MELREKAGEAMGKKEEENVQNQAKEAKEEHMQLEFEAKSENEEFARVVAAVFMSRLNPTLEEIEDVKTAVSEAVTNAIIHGYGMKGGKIRMELTAKMGGRGRLQVVVWDQGVGIADIKQAMEPMFTTDSSGERSGMGFSFMEAFMDQVTVESEPGKGTRVSMMKYIGR